MCLSSIDSVAAAAVGAAGDDVWGAGTGLKNHHRTYLDTKSSAQRRFITLELGEVLEVVLPLYQTAGISAGVLFKEKSRSL